MTCDPRLARYYVGVAATSACTAASSEWDRGLPATAEHQ